MIQGSSFQLKAEKGENNQKLAGKILKKIHLPIKKPKNFLKNNFDADVKKVFEHRYLRDLLELGGIKKIEFNVDWSEVFKLGWVFLHGDYWLEHIILSEKENQPYVIDWDYSTFGTPYQDFVTVQTSIIDIFNNGDDFWEGYGLIPDKNTINEYVKLECLRYFSFIRPDMYLREPKDGFYHKQMAILKKII